jgi:hypothetical protein
MRVGDFGGIAIDRLNCGDSLFEERHALLEAIGACGSGEDQGRGRSSARRELSITVVCSSGFGDLFCINKSGIRWRQMRR